MNVPKLRFKEFDGEWEESKLSNLLVKIEEKATDTTKGVVLTSSRTGLFPRSEYFNGREEKDIEGYSIVPKNTFTYRQMSDDNTFHINYNTKYDLGLVSPEYPVFKTNNFLTDEYFLNYINNSPRFKKHCVLQKKGGTRTRLYFKVLGELVIAKPSIEEQKKIGDFFNLLNKKIQLQQQKIDLLQEQKKGYQFKLLNNPDWKEIRLGDYAEIRGRLGWKGLKQEEYVEKGAYLIAGKHITRGNIFWDKCDQITIERYEESIEIALKENDIIFSKDGSLGNPAFIKCMPGKATINSTMMLVRVSEKDKLDSKFVYHILNSNIFRKLIHLKVSGSSIPHLFQADMKEFTFSVPSDIRTQKKISHIFDIIDKEIDLAYKKLDLLKLQKQGFMQQMFI